jgi:hypothetical protein
VAPGVSDRERKRAPARQSAELDDGWSNGRAGKHVWWWSVADAAVGADLDDGIGVLSDPFEPVFGHDDRDAKVVHETGDRGEDVLGGTGVKR